MFVGLNNQGATCYMNSLLQTLFSIPEFRQWVLSYNYSSSLENIEEDCIPLQLQLLFAQMQLAQNYPQFIHKLNCSTNDLIKAFQWDFNEQFQQHDVQEFQRVLFEAIQQSAAIKDDFTFQNIVSLFEGKSTNYVKCENGHLSERVDIWSDLSLPLKDFTTLQNIHSIEQAIFNQMKPEILDNNNQYSCEECGKKVNAEKGMRFTSLPDILSIHLSRFEFDWNTQNRTKINHFVHFPHVLNMNRYHNKYASQINLSHLDSIYKQFEEQIQKNPSVIEKKALNYTEGWAPIPQEYLTELPNMPKKKPKKQVQFMYDETVELEDFKNQFYGPIKIDNDDVVNKNGEINTQFFQDQFNQNQDKQVQVSNELTLDLLNIVQSFNDNENASNQTVEINQSTQQNTQQNNNTNQLVQSDTKLDQQYLQQEKELIKQYLQDGQYVYVLTAILIHKGTPYAGHYFTIIRYGDQWINFNDDKVSISSLQQIQDCYGNNEHYCSTGYLLMYRKYSDIQQPDIYINEKIEVKINHQITQRIHYFSKQEEERQQRLLSIRVKVHYSESYQYISIKKTDKAERLVDIAIQVLNIQKEKENLRLRVHDELLNLNRQVVDLQSTFEQLNFNDATSFFIESKTDQEVFQDYNPMEVNVKVFKYHDNIQSVHTALYSIIKVTKNMQVAELQKVLSDQFMIPQENLIILLRKPLINILYAINKENLHLPISTYDVDHFTSIYVEEQSTVMEQEFQWTKLYVEEKNKALISFNNPKLFIQGECPLFDMQIYIDNRLKLSDLKQKISEILDIPEDFFKMKRGSRFGGELKSLDDQIVKSGIINRGTIFVEMGTPSVDGQFLIQISQGSLKEASDSLDYDFNFIQNFKIDSTDTIEQIKIQILTFLKWEMPLEKIRIREKNQLKMGNILHPQKRLKDYKPYDNKAICFEILNDPEILVEGQRLIYYKVLNLKDFQLSSTKELWVDQSIKLSALNDVLSQASGINPKHLEACKIQNLYTFTRDDLVLNQMDWIQLKSNNEWQLDVLPWYIQRDSNLLILRDQGQEVGDWGEIRKQIKDKSTDAIPLPYMIGPKNIEKGVKITVKKQDNKE